MSTPITICSERLDNLSLPMSSVVAYLLPMSSVVSLSSVLFSLVFITINSGVCITMFLIGLATHATNEDLGDSLADLQQGWR